MNKNNTDMMAAPAPGRRPKILSILLVASAAITLAGCGLFGGKSDAPTGQVVATLDGEEITAREVSAELAGTPIPPSMSRRDAEKIALENIVTRRMLSKQAEERELTKTPEFLINERRAAEQLRVQALARDIAAKVVQPTRDEAEKFIAENPAMFGERKFYVLDQIQFLRPDNIATLGFEQAKTMESVEQILNANKIPFRRQPGSLDALGANPDFVKEISKVLATNPQELFMYATRPQGAPAPVVQVNQVKDVRVQPFTGDKAREFAVNYLKNERIQNALRSAVEAQQKTRAERVVFQKGWEPAPKKDDAKGKALPGAPDATAGQEHMGLKDAAASPAEKAETPAG